MHSKVQELLPSPRLSNDIRAGRDSGRLRIVQAIFTGGFAGSERVTVELCNALSEHHDVLLLVADDLGSGRDSILNHVNGQVHVKKIPASFRTIRVVLETWKFRADIYHAHLGRAVRCARFILRPTKCVATWHMARPVTTTGLDGVILISQWQTSLGLEGSGSPERIVISNWVTRFQAPCPEGLQVLREKIGLHKDNFVLGFVGRPTKRKRLAEALKAFQEWNAPDAVFIVVGTEAAEEDELQCFAADPRIRFLGHRTDVYDLYGIMDCLVLLAEHEAFGLVAIEAMRAGRQLIVNNSHGLKDIAASNPDIIAIDASSMDEIRGAYDTAFLRRHVKPSYNMSFYDAAARVSDIENFYLRLLEPVSAALPA